MPVSVAPNHQPSTTRVVTSSTTANNVTRFPSSVSTPARTTANVSQQIITAPTTTTRITATPSQPTGIVVHPQMMVATTKSIVHGVNHMTTARPIQLHNTTTGQKVCLS